MRQAATTNFLGNKDKVMIRPKKDILQLDVNMVKFCRYIYISM